ncbi:MAG: V-type ATP synthase subunit D, partial [Parachlamydiales bacterium]
MKLQFTKNALRSEEGKLKQLEKYLPTLKLKKLLLQGEVDGCQQQLELLKQEFSKARLAADEQSALLNDRYQDSPQVFLEVQQIKKTYENIAGLEAPVFEEIIFRPAEYPLFDTPVWFDGLLNLLKALITVRQKIL